MFVSEISPKQDLSRLSEITLESISFQILNLPRRAISRIGEFPCLKFINLCKNMDFINKIKNKN